ncbi:MAG: dienelactone hydrolase family protein, partial [Phenylobacterium sp.]|nr:dienelactone hydrolase family protein [Phenylobacterium sp.]
GRDHAFARLGGEHYHAADAALAGQRTLDFLRLNLGAA